MRSPLFVDGGCSQVSASSSFERTIRRTPTRAIRGTPTLAIACFEKPGFLKKPGHQQIGLSITPTERKSWDL
ncbi:MAG: hypothetical protein P5702_13350 [Limnospira sp. PMC 1291.21]|uniref:hypothetical protein n=1 Tax=unclassified Limnospira TaxID=2642885 RepID=UPI001314B71A|nr:MULTISPECIES: hypothetical protein [unclassified Limnospira]MDT9189652.1 hypothetical protein [Limnospira sp. PMC 894.15]MDT9225948.1 hypothetical protein [Limnospira sp. PMC 1279.21]MDT9259661.1 hypothetical protein [Limnospira sp. PMC 1236.20]MDT9281291.1 hypothetical protein [Limnospira sp. PMC 1293.21]MDT9285680.1 hypothetical protein [Limnospira sp. PMC 1298.21]MDT9290811.1 hypothetical protein [Limnospira sp. PMC 1295.21]MDT9326860.1 hypothetical protein [Limnospira sp. PMC 1286.21]